MKLKNIIPAFIVALAAVATASCSEEKLELYSGCKAGLFIQQVNTTDLYGNPISYRQGQTFSFANYGEDYKVHTVYFNVNLVGNVASYDRPYTIKVVADSTTAVEGRDYEIEGNQFSIKAGSAQDQIKVRLLRNSNLRQKLVRVYFRLEPNEHFELPIADYKNASSWNASGPQLSAKEYYVSFGEQYSEPFYWMFATDVVGKFSVTKFLEWNKCMGWTVDDWSRAGQSGAKIAYGRMAFAAGVFQKYLQKLADAGTPVIDDDGSYLQLVGNYMVDYSAYTNK